MEGWALSALESFMSQTGKSILIERDPSDSKRTLQLQGTKIMLKEWLPEGRSEDYHLSVIEPDSMRLRPKFSDQEKER